MNLALPALRVRSSGGFERNGRWGPGLTLPPLVSTVAVPVLELALKGTIGPSHLLRTGLAGGALGRHAAGPAIQHLGSDAQHPGKLLKQLLGRFAAAISQVTQIRRRQ